MAALEPSAGHGELALRARDAGAVVDCIELMEANHAYLLTLPGLRTIERRDFLGIAPSPDYDRIVMNQPFMKQADIKHVSHALGFLKPGGRLVSVMAAGVSFRTDARTTAFRKLIEERGGQVEALPEGSFKESGTGVNTVIAVIPA